MTEKRFKSKVDWWIFLLLLGAIVIDLVMIVEIAAADESPGAKTATILGGIGVMFLLASILLRTYYAVDKNVLRVVSGPFRWKIPVDQITSATPTRSLLSAPAMSLDRIKIKYGKFRTMVVSPADKEGFLRAIGHDAK